MSMLRQGGAKLGDNPVFRKLADRLTKSQQEDDAWNELYRRSHRRRSAVLQSSNPKGR